jgi:3'-5' exoribonuclease
MPFSASPCPRVPASQKAVARSKPPLLRLSDFTPGQYADCYALLAERTKGTTRDGKPFFTCRFRDARRTAACMVWSDGPWYEDCEARWREGQFYKLRVQYGEHERYGPQLEIHQIREATDADRADGFDPAELMAATRRDPEAMFAELKGLAETHIADLPLRRLVLTLLDRHAVAFKQLPATRRHFYPYPGGLLEHTLSVTHSCLQLADKYASTYPDLRPPLNRDLIVAGAILHDIGRVLELGGDPILVQPTVPGQLFGHLLLGRDLVRDAAHELGDVDPELVQLLEHLIITHLSLPEWGSPRLTLIPECLILHHADDLDAKLEMYVRCLRDDTAPGPFTDRDPVLGRQLLKGRSV